MGLPKEQFFTKLGLSNEDLLGLPDSSPQLPNYQLQALVKLGADAADQLNGRRLRSAWDESWRDLRGEIIDYEESMKRIRDDPTDEERERWKGMAEEEITADIMNYLREKEIERINGLRLVAEVDELAREVHIHKSSRLSRFLHRG